MNLKYLDDRHHRDPLFASVVKNLENLIENLQLTPSEVREAAIYACMRVEMRTTRPMIFSPGLEAHLENLGYMRARERKND
jgi:hypothetical protein